MAVCLCACAAGGADAPTPPTELRVEWAGNVPRLEVTIRAAQVPAELRELTVPLAITGASGEPRWTGNVKVTFNAERVGSGQVEARLPDKADAPYRVSLEVRNAALGVEALELASFSAPGDAVRQHGLRVIGRYPHARVELILGLKTSDRVLEVEATVRDRERNQILRKTERLLPEKEAQLARIDLTPPPRAVGPFAVEYQVANEAAGVNLRYEQRFACANAVIPFTTMQSDRLIDWYRSTFPSPDGFGKSGNYTGIPFNSKDNVEPALFDNEVFHSGGRSLRLSYRAGTTTHLYSNLQLPGFPIRAYLWVKGNKSGDRLVATFRDYCELGRQPWERHVNKNRAVICALDFDGWRRFEAPIVGEGLQGDSRHEKNDAVIAPVYLFAFSVESAPPKESEAADRTLWIDDLAIETQTALAERASLELRADTSDAQLRPDGKFIVAIGNGTGGTLADGRLQLTARDRRGNNVFDATRTVEADTNAFALVEIPMSRLSEARPDGPVAIEVTFAAPSAGLRLRRSLALKAPKHAAVFWDFEDQQYYNNLGGAVGGTPAAGGAEGTPQALAVVAPTNGAGELILHPALPGIPTRIEMLVKGGAVPVYLRPLFLDAGRTGAYNMPYNRLLTPEILVDWTEWRRIVAIAPPVPVGYDDPNRTFLYEPSYPLNLILSARAAGQTPGEILVDRITVQTHLDETNAVTVGPVYADEKEILAPDSALALRIRSFLGEARQQTFEARLSDIHGQPVFTESRTLTLAPGQALVDTLVPRLPRGVYNLEVAGAGMQPVKEQILAVNLADYFGDKPATMLRNLPALERQSGMAIRRIYLDWDNLELGPGMFHFNWFHNEIAKAAEDGKYRVAAILGFSADWAGPEKSEAVRKKAYERFIGNHMQVPVRLTDWNIYAREAVREFAGKVAAWEFWENPDFRGSPAYIPPERYRDMLGVVRRWVDWYDPKTPLIAAGFSAENMYDYLRNISEPHTLPFDSLGIHFNIGELSPEGADMEGLFDDLNGLLKLDETKRGIDIPQLDWAVGERVSPLQQAAYHARAGLIINRNVREPYRVKLVNDGETFEGYGLFHRRSYGNTPNVQGARPLYVPKPAYFALVTTRRMLEKSRFDGAIRIPDREAAANYAYLYEKEGGVWMAALWRARGEPRLYRAPADWKDATLMDAFGTVMPPRETVRLGPVPLFVAFPAGRAGGRIRHDLRMLEPDDGRDRRWLVLMTAEPDSARRAEYRAAGSAATLVRRDRRLVGGEPVENVFLTGLTEEQFVFTAGKPGTCRLTRTWFGDAAGTNSHLAVSLNGGPGQPWDLSLSETGRNLKQYGVRESSLLLPGVISGANRIAVRHLQPGNTACWTVAPLADNTIDLAYWEPITAVQSKGFPLASLSARGTPLRIGDRTYATGVGALAPSYIEYPLQQRFGRFEVTVGIDAAGRGRGNVVFSIYGDGKLLKSSGGVTGFSPAQKLVVEDLGEVSRLALRVVNADKDGSDGLADWVDAKLSPKGIDP